jgi:hypothetical protein
MKAYFMKKIIIVTFHRGLVIRSLTNFHNILE